jgi:hypothetical protein
VLCLAYAAGGPARMLVDAWMRPRTNQEHNALAEDVSADRWYRFISRPWPYAVAMHLHAGISLWLARRWWGAAGVLGIWLTLAALYNAGDAIDSVAHVFGRKLEKQQDESRNSAWMGILVTPRISSKKDQDTDNRACPARRFRCARPSTTCDKKRGPTPLEGIVVSTQNQGT